MEILLSEFDQKLKNNHNNEHKKYFEGASSQIKKLDKLCDDFLINMKDLHSDIDYQ